MRRNALIVIVVVFAIVGVIAFFFRDRYVERGLEKAGEMAAGAKVEIDGFHFSLLGLEASWERLQVADRKDPWRNIVETGPASFDVEGRPLFWKRLIIREAVLENVRTGTARATDGSLPEPEVEAGEEAERGFADKARDSMEKRLQALPVFDPGRLGKELKVDSLVDVKSLASVKGYQHLIGAADSTYKHWSTQLEPEPYLDRVKALKRDMQALKLNEIKDPLALRPAIQKLDKIQIDARALKSDVEGKRDGFRAAYDELRIQLQSTRAALANDIARAKRLARLGSLDLKDVGLLLLGEPVVARIQQVMDYVGMGRKYLPTAKKLVTSDKVEKPPRFRGQNIRFPFHHRYPSFLIREMRLSAATAAGDTSRGLFVEGTIRDLTTEPSVLGKPTRLDLSVAKRDGNKYALTGVLDHVTEHSRDSLWVRAMDFGLGHVALSRRKMFPHTMIARKGDVSMSGFFVEEKVEMKLDLTASPVEFQFGEVAGDKASRIVQDILTGLDRVELEARVTGDTAGYKVHMRSNLDHVLGERVREIFDRELAVARKQLEDRVRSEADMRRKEAEALVAKHRQALQAKIDEVTALLEAQLDEIEKKKQEALVRVDTAKKQAELRAKEAEQKAKEKAKKKIRDLLGKP